MLSKELTKRSVDENKELTETLPEDTETPLFGLFQMGWRNYDALSKAFDAYLTQYKSPRHTLLRGVTESLQDLRRYLKQISVLLRKGGIYDNHSHGNGYGK